MRSNQRWLVVATVGAIVMAPSIVYAAVGSFSSTTATAAVTATSTYAAGKGVYGRDTSTSATQHYGVFGQASGTGGIGVYGSGTKYGVYSAGPLGVVAGKNLVCTRCVTTADVGILPAAAVYNPSGTNITLIDSIPTALTFSGELFDTANLHGVTNTSRLTAPVKGLYMVTGSVRFASNTTGKRELYVMKGGSTLVQTESALPLGGTNDTIMGITTLVSMNAGEYVELLAYQGSGGTLDVVGCAPSGSCPRFTMNFVSAMP